MATKEDWKVTGISLSERTGGYTLKGSYQGGERDGEYFAWDMQWAELAKDHSRFSFADTVWERRAHERATRLGHAFPGLEGALVVG